MKKPNLLLGTFASLLFAVAAVAGADTNTQKVGDVLAVDLGDGVKLELTWIPPGEFDMSSPHGEEGRVADESPRHRVTFSNGFWMGKFEVTQQQWQQVMGNNPSHFQGARLPVEQVSWDDCQEFIKRLNTKLADQKYKASLPTEAQWEYACRAGTQTRFHTGAAETDLVCAGWFAANSERTTHEAGQKEKNAWGLYDMHGNVWEWCQDWYGPYSREVAMDPTGPDSGADRVLRGGSWGSLPNCCRASHRFSYPPTYTIITAGLRVVVVRH